MSSPEKAWIDLTTKGGPVRAKEVATFFSALKPVGIEVLLRGNGEWRGSDINTGHPASARLNEMKWAGKTFRSAEDVDPIVVFDDNGNRVWNGGWGRARLREVKFEGTITATMIYDDHPIIDYFRFVSDDIVAGVMDAKGGAGGMYYFSLSRLS